MLGETESSAGFRLVAKLLLHFQGQIRRKSLFTAWMYIWGSRGADVLLEFVSPLLTTRLPKQQFS